MSPRPYRSTARRTAADQTRANIVAAARELLASGDGAGTFSVDAVARKAGVVRMTVYYQFGSKAGLLEALYDDLATRGHIERLRTVFTLPDPLAALDAFVATFGGFYDSDRLVIRRLNALAALDADISRGLVARGERRREGTRTLIARIAGAGIALRVDAAEAADVLGVVTGFDTYDMLAGESQTIVDVVPVVQRLARAAIVGAG